MSLRRIVGGMACGLAVSLFACGGGNGRLNVDSPIKNVSWKQPAEEDILDEAGLLEEQEPPAIETPELPPELMQELENQGGDGDAGDATEEAPPPGDGAAESPPPPNP